MKVLKKFLLGFIAAMPISAGAVAPLVLGGLAAGVGIIGVSIWRTVAPVDVQQAFNFFSSCWTCQVFSDVMISMSNLLPGVYQAIGRVVIPMSVSLLAIFIAWRLVSGFLNGKADDASKVLGNFSTYTVKFCLLTALLLMPLPRLITNILIEPAVNIGSSFDYVVSENNTFSECMIATAIADPVSISADASNYGAFSPKLRHQLACQVANVHQITGLGMTVGWTMLNMAFNTDYMHKVLAAIPIFPNVPLLFCGLLVLVLYFFALLPIPLYFLEVFIKLSMDLIMLPLMLMAWMFDDDNFAIFPKGGRTIRQMVDDVVKAMVGIALTVIFLAFSIMFLNAAFGVWTGAETLQQAIMSPDSNVSAKFLMDGLMMNNDSLVTVILMGIFIAMFMTMIPQLTSMLFKIKISDKYYKTAINDIGLVWKGFKKIMPGAKNKSGKDSAGSSGDGGFGGMFGGGQTSSNSNDKYTRIKWLESTGWQYINVGFRPDNKTSILVRGKLKNSQNADAFLFGVRNLSQKQSFALEVFHHSNPNSVYAECGSYDGDFNASQSLSDELITVFMSEHGVEITKVSNNSKVLTGTYSVSAFSSADDMFLFAANNNGTGVSGAACFIYECSVFDDNNIIRHFIPVLDKDGTPCMYEDKEKKFYYNDGLANFFAGPTI